MDEESKPRVYVTRRIPEAGLSMLRRACSVRVWEGELPVPREVLLEEVRGVEGLLTLLTDTVDQEILAVAPRLRVISNYAVGYNNIDVAACSARGIPVGHTPGVLTDTTADFAFALLLAAARRVTEGVAYVREGQWKTWGPQLLLGKDVHDATLGLLGFGRIGQAVARRGLGFGMRVLYYDPFVGREVQDLGEPVDLETLWSESDFLSIHVPLTEQTYHLVDANALGKMRRGAVLVNTARGPVVDHAALLDALTSGKLAAAALDVTDPEPLPSDHPLVRLPNCIVTPHIASASVATRAKMAVIAAENLLAGLEGRCLPHCVNPEVCLRT